MAEINLHPDLIRIRDKYRGVKCVVDRWEEIKRLVLAGKSEKAEEIAKACLKEYPRIAVRHKVAIRHRILRREYLRFQRDQEMKIADILRSFGEKLSTIVLAAADPDGKIKLVKLKPLITRIENMNKDVYREIRIETGSAIRKSIKFGITISAKSAQDGIDMKNEMNGKTKEGNS